MYDAKWYLGKVLETDVVDNTMEVTVLEATATRAENCRLKWLQNPDELWIPQQNILAVVQPCTGFLS